MTEVDVAGLKRVLFILVGNALKFTRMYINQFPIDHDFEIYFFLQTLVK
jgi:hypothetical protein